MLGPVVSAALIVVQLPGDVALPPALHDANIEIVVQSTQNHFAAENLSVIDQLLLFGDEDQGAFSGVRLEPGERVVYPFPRGSVDDLWVEVIAMSEPHWRNTGALSIRAARDTASGAMWVQGSLDRSITWLQGANGLQHVRPTYGLVPDGVSTARPELATYASAPSPHVPIPTPDDERGDDDKPIELEKKPLPPV